ncbi:MAG: ubiquinol-cytochrome C chaperone [Alphaproteobacteria bacterium]|nr:ubiquinol-cytochrome C chaperone [Alphaproteobacteria bacterium]MBU2380510.1 ubiquinol-cytochrome C chaperone [Alphaproteobacteria bacterium]
MLKNLFRPRPAERMGLPLYSAAVDQARDPRFYTALGVADEIDARFELYTLHVLLLILRLRDEAGAEAERGAEAAQNLFDVYVSALDNALRELGVNDVTMAKKMRKLGEALYGRMTAYEASVRAADASALAASLAKNVYGDADVQRGAALAAYALEARAMLASQPIGTVLTQPLWPEAGA